MRKIVLLSGFESFNVALYKSSARDLKKRFPHVELLVFSDRDIDGRREELEAALEGADVFFGSLLFDYDQVEWLRERIADIPLRFVFESALELMSCTNVRSFQMAAPGGKKAGPPPAVKAVLSKFGSGKEEDKLVGYLSFLKIGPQLLKFVPGEKARDLKNWLTVYWRTGIKEGKKTSRRLSLSSHLNTYYHRARTRRRHRSSTRFSVARTLRSRRKKRRRSVCTIRNSRETSSRTLRRSVVPRLARANALAQSDAGNTARGCVTVPKTRHHETTVPRGLG